MKITGLSFKTYTLAKFPLSFRGEINPLGQTKQDTFERNKQDETSDFIRRAKFKNALVEKSQRHNVGHIIDEIVGDLTKDGTKSFPSVINSLHLTPEELGAKNARVREYREKLKEEIPKTPLLDFVNSDSYIPEFDGKKPNLSLHAKLMLLDRFVFKEGDGDLSNPESISKIRDIIKTIYTKKPDKKRDSHAEHAVITYFQHQDIGLKVAFDIKGELLSIRKKSASSATEKRPDKLQLNSIIHEKIPAQKKSSACFKPKALTKKSKQFSLWNIEEELKKHKRDYANILKYCNSKDDLVNFINSTVWLPQFDDDTMPNLTLHARLRLVERFVLDTSDSSALKTGEAKEKLREILEIIYTQEPEEKVQSNANDGSYIATFPYGDYGLRAIFNNDGNLITIVKRMPDDVVNFDSFNIAPKAKIPTIIAKKGVIRGNFISQLPNALTKERVTYEKEHVAREIQAGEDETGKNIYANITKTFEIDRNLWGKNIYQNTYFAVLNRLRATFVKFINSPSWMIEFSDGSIPNLNLETRLKLINEFLLDEKQSKTAIDTDGTKKLKYILRTIYTDNPKDVRQQGKTFIATFNHSDGFKMIAKFSNDGRLLSIKKEKKEK